MSTCLSPTGRFARSEPVIQNLPGSLADALSWAFERNDYSEVWRRLAAGQYGECSPVAPPCRDTILAGDYSLFEKRADVHD